MRITASAAHLAAQIGWVATHLPTRPAIPVLAGLRLDISPEQVTVTGTDYDVWAQASLDADTEGTGTLVLPGRLVADLLARLPATHMVTLQAVDSGRVRLVCGPTRASLRTLPAEDYPTPPAWPSEVGRIEAADLARATARVVVAAGTEEALPTLTGVHLYSTDQGLVLEATDRYRAAQDTVDWTPTLQEGAAAPVHLVVGAPTLTRAVKSLTGRVAVGVERDPDGRAQVLGLSDETRRLSVRLIDGDYPTITPSHQRALDQAAATVAVDSTALADAVDRARLFTDRNTPIALTVEHDHLVVRGGADGDDTVEDVPAKTTSPQGAGSQLPDEELQGAFQAPWLLAAVAACRSEQVHLTLARDHHPTLVSSAEADPYWHLIMPVRLSGGAP